MEFLLIVESDIATTQLVEQVLSKLSVTGGAVTKKYLEDLTLQDLESSAVPFFVRSADPRVIKWIKFLKDQGKPYVFYIDDDFWALEGNSAIALYYQTNIIRDTLNQIIHHADLVVCSTDPLSEKVREINPRTKVLTSFFNFDLLPVNKPRAETVTVGFAGSTSRILDLEYVFEALVRVSARFPEVRFEFIGATPSRIGELPNARHFTHLQSYEEYVAFQISRGWNIGLAPLVDSEAGRSKTNNKFREYAAFGIAGVYSDVIPYSLTVEHGLTGILVANSTDSWESSLSELIENTSLRNRIVENAFAYVKETYSLDVVLNEWRLALSEIQGKPMKFSMRDKFSFYIQDRHQSACQLRALQVQLAYREGGIGLVFERFCLAFKRKFRQSR